MKKIITFIFLSIITIYLADALINTSLHSKRNLGFILVLVPLVLVIFFLLKKYKQIIFISVLTVFLTDIFFNLFLQDSFPQIKIKPLLKNSVQKSALYLDDWPYFKFKANIIAETHGDRGEDCVYTWKTDSLGFKNINVKKNYNFVTVGDSYVEGMCTSIDHTIAEYLNKKNINTYNLGVQGWSDKQSISALKIVEDNKINYDGVIFGYLADRFNREKNFIGKATQKGGLGKIIEVELRKGKSLFVTREIMQTIFGPNKFNWSKEFLKTNISENIEKNKKKIKLKDEYKDIYLPKNYRPTIIQWSERANIDFQNNDLIKILNSSILNLSKKLQDNKKKFIIFVFPLRSDVLGHIIYEDGYICETDYYKAVKRVNNLLKDTNYIYLDFFDDAVNLTKKWIDTRNYDYFIWKYKDPHYSKIGNKLVADTIESYLKYNIKGSKDYLMYCN